jgi:hypothetical protein
LQAPGSDRRDTELKREVGIMSELRKALGAQLGDVYVFDNENTVTLRPRMRLARGCGCGCGCSYGCG